MPPDTPWREPGYRRELVLKQGWFCLYPGFFAFCGENLASRTSWGSVTNRHRAGSLEAQGLSGFYPSKTPLRPTVSALKRLRSVPLQTTGIVPYCRYDIRDGTKGALPFCTVFFQFFSTAFPLAMGLRAYIHYVFTIWQSSGQRDSDGAESRTSPQWVPLLYGIHTDKPHRSRR